VLSEENVQKIHVIQEENMKKFGETAKEPGLASAGQIKEALEEGESEYLMIGQTLVKLDLIDESTMNAKLDNFEPQCKANDPRVSRVTLFVLLVSCGLVVKRQPVLVREQKYGFLPAAIALPGLGRPDSQLLSLF
jgi:hypothetical protein